MLFFRITILCLFLCAPIAMAAGASCAKEYSGVEAPRSTELISLLKTPEGLISVIDRLVRQPESLSGDLRHSQGVIDRELIEALSSLPAERKALAQAKLMEERRQLQNGFDTAASSEGVSADAKIPKRNLQLLQLALARNDFLAMFQKLRKTKAKSAEAIIPSVEEFLAKLTGEKPAYSLQNVISVARTLQTKLGKVLKSGDEVEIFGSFPNLQARNGKSDIDLFFSDRLDNVYRSIQGGIYGDESYVNSRQSLALALVEAESALQKELKLESAPGSLFGVSVRQMSKSKTMGEVEEESRRQMMGYFSYVSPVSIVISPKAIKMRIYDAFAANENGVAPFLEFPVRQK